MFITAADFDRDGNLDLAVSNYSSHNVSILVGDGAGSFSVAFNYPDPIVLAALNSPAEVMAGDLNGDGQPDLAVVGNISNNVATMLNTTPIPVPTCRGQDATLVGTEGDDILVGTPGRDVIVGLGGNDVIDGAGGYDRICGGPGNDSINGGPGKDRLFGGPGRDSISGGPGNDRLFGNRGYDTLFGNDGNDSLFGGKGSDNLIGGEGIDICKGGPGSNLVASCEGILPPAGMTGWWPGDANANDIMGTNHGTLLGGATFGPGKVGSAFSFNGTTANVQVPNAALNNLPAGTIDMWINPSANTSAGFGFSSVWFAKQHDFVNTYAVFGLVSTSDSRVKFHLRNAVPEVTGTTPLALNTWHHVAATWDGASIKVYVDGVKEGEVASSATLPSDLGGITAIGALIGSGGGFSFFTGSIDEVEIFNRALTVKEIRAIYNAGSEGKIKP